MFDFIKKLFAKQNEPIIEEIKEIQLNEWFNQKVSQLEYNQQFQDYFQQIKQLKEQLTKRVTELRQAQISKDNQKVEGKIKNIVSGHRDNYTREIEQFVNNLEIIEKDKFSSLTDYQEIINYNNKLDQELSQLAKRTAKSYQATQHLYFKAVEAVFKLMGEINLLVKNFNKNEIKEKVEKLAKIEEFIKQLKEEKEKRKDIKEKISRKEKNLEKIENMLVKENEAYQRLKESSELQNYLKLKEEEEKLNQQIKDVENEIFQFFSKLNKPLKKYERIALDNKLIKLYLENYLKAFTNDPELEINDILLHLKNSLTKDSLKFEEKQKNKFIAIIDDNNLAELRSKLDDFGKIRKELVAGLNQLKINQEIKQNEQEISKVKDKIKQKEEDISNLKSFLEKINLDEIKSEIRDKIKEVFNIELSLS